MLKIKTLEIKCWKLLILLSCCKLCYALILINFLVQAQKNKYKEEDEELSLMVLLHLICINFLGISSS